MRRNLLAFLSCLSGSERRKKPAQGGLIFLSCLSGSEPTLAGWRAELDFLSCLSGSELGVLASKILIVKEFGRNCARIPNLHGTP